MKVDKLSPIVIGPTQLLNLFEQLLMDLGYEVHATEIKTVERYGSGAEFEARRYEYFLRKVAK